MALNIVQLLLCKRHLLICKSCASFHSIPGSASNSRLELTPSHQLLAIIAELIHQLVNLVVLQPYFFFISIFSKNMLSSLIILFEQHSLLCCQLFPFVCFWPIVCSDRIVVADSSISPKLITI